MAFPTSIVSFLGFTASHTLATDQHAAQHNSEQTEIIALEQKVGLGSSTPAAHTVLKSNTNGSSIWDSVDLANDITGTLPVTNGGTGATTAGGARSGLSVYSQSEVDTLISNVKQALYPIGCIYTEITGTNPNTTFGFGTWVAFGAGKVPVGLDSGDTDFNTPEETGGAKTVAGAPHSHVLSDNGQAQIYFVNSTGADVLVIRRITAASWSPTISNSTSIAMHTYSGSASTVGAALTGSTDSATPSATSVVQPYIVVYMWKRTA